MQQCTTVHNAAQHCTRLRNTTPHISISSNKSHTTSNVNENSEAHKETLKSEAHTALTISDGYQNRCHTAQDSHITTDQWAVVKVYIFT